MDTNVNDTTTREADLSRSLREILDTLSEVFADRLTERIGGILPDFEARQKRTDYALEGIRSSLSRLETAGGQTELLDNANRTIRLLGEGFYDEKIVQPMVRGLFPVVDLLEQAMAKQDADSGILSALLAQLEQFLALYGVESYRHEPNADFVPSLMKPLQTAATDEPSLDGLVAESLQCGFRTSDRILRLETVSLYRFDVNLGTDPVYTTLQKGTQL